MFKRRPLVMLPMPPIGACELWKNELREREQWCPRQPASEEPPTSRRLPQISSRRLACCCFGCGERVWLIARRPLVEYAVRGRRTNASFTPLALNAPFRPRSHRRAARRERPMNALRMALTTFKGNEGPNEIALQAKFSFVLAHGFPAPSGLFRLSRPRFSCARVPARGG